MPRIEKVYFDDLKGVRRKVDLVGEQATGEGFFTTVLTGENGSYKSTILKNIVADLATNIGGKNVEISGEVINPRRIICVSGSVADRFPAKEIGGRPTEFDTPEYIYIGQRVGTNLLSKKLPLETAVIAALDPAMQHRYKWGFFQEAFAFAGTQPLLKLEIRPSQKYKQFVSEHLQYSIEQFAFGEPDYNRFLKPSFSPAMARFIFREFESKDFQDLLDTLSRKGKIQLNVGYGLRATPDTPLKAIRLGLILDALLISTARLVSHENSEFSIYDLSSGEYHMLTTLLGIGFTISDGCILLVDEPENSLHPRWQKEFMSSVQKMISQLYGGHLIVSTHAPLIVSSAEQGSAIVDLSREPSITQTYAVPYGASADGILLEQFGVASSRNAYVVDIVQHAIDLTEAGEDGLSRLQAMAPKLLGIREALPTGDPLVEIIDALLEAGA